MTSAFDDDDENDSPREEKPLEATLNKLSLQSTSSDSSLSFKEAIDDTDLLPSSGAAKKQYSPHLLPAEHKDEEIKEGEDYEIKDGDVEEVEEDDFDEFVGAAPLPMTEQVNLSQLREIARRHAPKPEVGLAARLRAEQEAMIQATEIEIFEQRTRLSRRTSLDCHSYRLYQRALSELPHLNNKP